MTTRTIWCEKRDETQMERNEAFLVVHPLDDRPEQKVGNVDLGPMRMTRAVRFSLAALRVYLILMTFMLLYHVIGFLGPFGQHAR